MSQAFLDCFHQACANTNIPKFLDTFHQVCNTNTTPSIQQPVKKPRLKRKYVFKQRKVQLKTPGQKKNIDLIDAFNIRQCMSVSCNNGCINRFSFDEVLLLRKEYIALGTEVAKLMFVTSCRKMTNGKNVHVLDKECCSSCFKKLYGITEYKWKQATKAHSQRISPNAEHGSKNKTKETLKKK